jgi:hypothetical protein
MIDLQGANAIESHCEISSSWPESSLRESLVDFGDRES